MAMIRFPAFVALRQPSCATPPSKCAPESKLPFWSLVRCCVLRSPLSKLCLMKVGKGTFLFFYAVTTCPDPR